ncbi:hypothetical protein HO173_006064 [Letharia columbiana]|uniref:FAD-binding domain-containing protein n=1 Tax=Letharia columbiana TaxID=112416 RepID=A0A8H6FW75_9LECA|nr:uncharacterized protein HO173_006064 [Letharia columbiana]KAF6235868.1 hypothetical protein HO173_006064 [Letharia columbiana]
MPDDFVARIQGTQVDPNIPTSDADRLPFINGQTGERIGEIKSSKFYRLRRDKFRKLLMEGLDIKWEKSLTDIIYSADETKVTARFADGTKDTGSLSVASDGTHSTVRELLVGAEKAKVTPTEFATSLCFTKHSRERALFLRSTPFHPLYQVAPHPNGYFGWLSLHDGDDVDHPEKWTFFHYIVLSRASKRGKQQVNGWTSRIPEGIGQRILRPFQELFRMDTNRQPLMVKKDPSEDKPGESTAESLLQGMQRTR